MVSTDEILQGIPEVDTEWLVMPIEKAERFTNPI
jgi:hypothetical protein